MRCPESRQSLAWFITRVNCNLSKTRSISLPFFFFFSLSPIGLRNIKYRSSTIAITFVGIFLGMENYLFIGSEGLFRNIGIHFVKYVEFLVIGKVRLRGDYSWRAWKGVINPVPIPLNPKLGIYWLSKLPLNGLNKTSINRSTISNKCPRNATESIRIFIIRNPAKWIVERVDSWNLDRLSTFHDTFLTLLKGQQSTILTIENN